MSTMPIHCKRKDVATINLSFAGCGFLCIYHAGVVAAIKEYAPQLTSNRICGASAGAIAAAGLLCNVCVSKSMDIILNVVRQARAGSLRALSPMFNLIDMVRAGLEKILPSNAHLICTGRLFISLTRARDYKNVVVSEFRTRDELIQAIVCSSFIPFYCGRDPPKYRGVAYIDGGVSVNQPNLDAHTITVSPFSGESDICPVDADSASMMHIDFCGTSIRLTSANLCRIVVCLFPPPQDICAEICRRGFSDAMRFLRRRGLAPCDDCLLLEARVFGSARTAAATKEQEMAGALRRTKTMPNFAKPRRIEECDRCLEKFKINHYDNDIFDLPLPELVQKTLDDALAAESTWYRYLRSYRLIRWTMRCMTPVIFPVEVILYSARKMREIISTYTRLDFYAQQFQRMADFVLEEIDKRNLIFDTSTFADTSPHILEPYWTSEMREAMAGRHAALERSTLSVDERLISVGGRSSQSSAEEFYSVVSDPSFAFCVSDLPETNDGEWIQDLRLSISSEHPPTDSPLLEKAAGNHLAETSYDASAVGEDSGLSLTDDSSTPRQQSSSVNIRKRDFACSPMRRAGSQRVVFGTANFKDELSSSSSEEAAGSSQIQRRRHFASFSCLTNDQPQLPASDDDETLFVPSRQRLRN